jgi:hypothetical protein
MAAALLSKQPELPTCAVCLRSVQEVSTWRPQDRIGVTTYRVKCHGKVQQFDVNDFDLTSAEQISVGKAFVDMDQVIEALARVGHPTS